jgi:hypothetical protein
MVIVLAVFAGCKTPEAAPVAEAPKVEEAKAEHPTAEHPKAEEPKVAAKLVMRVNCGSSVPYEDEAGNKWLAGRAFDAEEKYGSIGGTAVERVPQKIEGTKCPKVYLTELYGMTGYKFLVPNGTYTVRLHFAETFEEIYMAGERVFDVAVQDKAAIKGMDPFKEGGGLFKPVVKEVKDVEVKNGELVIGFKENVQQPEINGIEVIQQ